MLREDITGKSHSRPKASRRHAAKIPSLRGEAIRDAIMEYLEDWFSDGRTFSPSIREIGEHVGLSSSSTVHSHLNTLRRELRLAPAVKNRARCIRPASVSAVKSRVLGLARVVVDTTQDEGAVELLAMLEGMFGEAKRCED